MGELGGLGNIMIGYFFGFALGVGCALAVMCSIWSGGYRKALEHSLMEPKPERYRKLMAAVQGRREREAVKEAVNQEGASR